MNEDRGLFHSHISLAVADICNGSGTCEVYLRSGQKFAGRPNRTLSNNGSLFLHVEFPVGRDREHAEGWAVIDMTEIVAITGVPR